MVYRAAITNNIVKQALHLNRNLAFINNKLDKIFVLTALILVSVTFEGNQKLFQTSIKSLSNEIKGIADRNGFVESKNPEDQFWLIHHLVLIREFLIFSQNTVPEFLDHNIQKIGSNYKGLLFSNNFLPLFNGCKKETPQNLINFLKRKVINLTEKQGTLLFNR